MAAPSITVAILAGGASRRMNGIDKGLLDIDGRPMIAWILHALDAMRLAAAPDGSLPMERLIVANRHHDRYAAYATTIADDADAGQGPLAGIATALAAVRTDYVISMPVDCPWPAPSLLSRLSQRARLAQCRFAHDGDRPQPLFAVYCRSLAMSAMVASRAGQGPSGWQRSLGAVAVDFSDERRHFSNLNSADDIAHYQRPAHAFD